MDKQLLKAYVRTIVEDEVRRILPEVLSEAVTEIKQLAESKQPPTRKSDARQKIDRGRLAQLMGVSFEGDTLRTSTERMALPEGVNPTNADPAVVEAITKDYSALMKAMKIT